MKHTCLVVSGKGGVGKTTLAAALGHALCRRGYEVCILDADIGLRDQDAMLGLQDHVVYDLLDVVKQKCPVERALIVTPNEKRLSLLPAAQFARVKDVQPKQLRKLIEKLQNRFDYILIDAPAGIEKGLRNLLSCGADTAIVVVTPDDICVRDAERVVALLREKTEMDIRLVVNRLMPELIEASEMYGAATVSQALDIPLLGEVPQDDIVYRAQLRRISLMDCEAEAARAVTRIAARLDGEEQAMVHYGTRKRPFWTRVRHRAKELKLLDR